MLIYLDMFNNGFVLVHLSKQLLKHLQRKSTGNPYNEVVMASPY